MIKKLKTILIYTPLLALIWAVVWSLFTYFNQNSVTSKDEIFKKLNITFEDASNNNVEIGNNNQISIQINDPGKYLDGYDSEMLTEIMSILIKNIKEKDEIIKALSNQKSPHKNGSQNSTFTEYHNIVAGAANERNGNNETVLSDSKIRSITGKIHKNQIKIQEFHHEAQSAIRKGDYEKGISVLNKLQKRESSQLYYLATEIDNALTTAASTFAQKGLIERERKNYFEAITNYKNAASLVPDKHQSIQDGYIEKYLFCLYVDGVLKSNIESLAELVDVLDKVSDDLATSSAQEMISILNFKGNVFAEFGLKTLNTEYLARALNAYDDGIKLAESDINNHRIATLQRDKGMLLSQWGDRDGNINMLYEAQKCFYTALDYFKSNRKRIDLQVTYNSLGLNLFKIGEKEGDLEYIKDALKYLFQSKDVIDKKQHVAFWSTVMNNIGIILSNVGLNGCDNYFLQEAQTYFSESLSAINKSDYPFEWARAKSNAGLNSLRFGMCIEQKQLKLKYIEVAIDNYREALSVYTSQDTPVDWAQIKINIIAASTEKIKIVGKCTNSKEVQKTLMQVINIFQQAGASAYLKYSHEVNNSFLDACSVSH